MPVSERSLVTIAMPALNEERYVAAAIASLLPEGDDGFDCEIFVADGGSTDTTARIVRLLGRGNPAIQLLVNAKQNQAAGVNLVARAASPRSNIVIRADCHAVYPPGFVATCVRALGESGAASVVVPMRTVGVSFVQRAIAAAQNSRLGNGGSAHRLRGGASRFVDHGHHAAFDRRIFLDQGGYDEDFTANEDAEFDRRLTASGERIWLADQGTITYYPRASFASLARQYFKYGTGRARTVGKQKTGLRPRQMLPLVALLGCVSSILLGVVDPLFLIIAAGYLGLCLAWGFVVAAQTRSASALLSGVAAVVMHLSWGSGFIVERFRASRLPSRLRPGGTVFAHKNGPAA